jgi:hypothetical protein
MSFISYEGFKRVTLFLLDLTHRGIFSTTIALLHQAKDLSGSGFLLTSQKASAYLHYLS